MKIRNGFVSNSSSSSFLIYGISGINLEDVIVTQDIVDKINERRKKYGQALCTIEDLKESVGCNISLDDPYISLDDICSCFDLSCRSPYSSYYVGISWSNVGGNETGDQFKERVKKILSLIFGEEKASQCETHSEAWYDG